MGEKERERVLHHWLTSFFISVWLSSLFLNFAGVPCRWRHPKLILPPYWFVRTVIFVRQSFPLKNTDYNLGKVSTFLLFSSGPHLFFVFLSFENLFVIVISSFVSFSVLISYLFCLFTFTSWYYCILFLFFLANEYDWTSKKSLSQWVKSLNFI